MAKPLSTYRKKSENRQNTYMKSILLALISIVLMITPFYRGLYFRENYIPAILAISIVFAVYLVYKHSCKDRKIIDTYMDLVIIAIPICYLISFIFGVNAKDGLDSFLLYSGYFMLFKIASDVTKDDEKKRELLVNAIIVITFIIGFSSILALLGVINIKGAVEWNRLYGPYQYPNTTASVLGVGIVLTINTLIKTEKLSHKLVYQIVLTTLITSFVFTLSRGGLLAIAVVLLLNFVVISPKNKIRMIVNFIISTLAGALLVLRFYTNHGDNSTNLLVYYLFSILVCVGLSYVFDYTIRKLNIIISDRKINTILIIVVTIFIMVIAFLFTAKEPIEYKIEHAENEEKSWKNQSIYINEVEPDTTYTLEFEVKSSAITPNSYGVAIRSYNSDAEYEEIYKEFNSVGDEFEHKKIEFTTLNDTERVLLLLYNYENNSHTTYRNIAVRDSYGNTIKKIEKLKYIPETIAKRLMDINLETDNASLRIYFVKDGFKIFKDSILVGGGGGAWKNLYRQYQSLPYNSKEAHNFYIQYAVEVGLLGLIPLLLLMTQFVIGLVKSIRDKSSYLPVYIAVMLIFLHSSIDFNLSLPAAAFFLWVLLGILNTDNNIKRINIVKTRVPYIVIAVLGIIIIALTSSMYYGINTGVKAARNANSNYDEAINLFKKAMKFDRFNAAYRVDYAQLMNLKLSQTKDGRYFTEMMKQIDMVNKYEPYNIDYMSVIINLMLSNGLFEEAASLADINVEIAPMVPNSYIQKTQVNHEIAKYYFSTKQHSKAIPYLENMIETEKEYKEANSRAVKPIELPKDYNMRTDLALNWIEQANRIESLKKNN
mgnify:CR=1 FL=1